MKNQTFFTNWRLLIVDIRKYKSLATKHESMTKTGSEKQNMTQEDKTYKIKQETTKLKHNVSISAESLRRHIIVMEGRYHIVSYHKMMLRDVT